MPRPTLEAHWSHVTYFNYVVEPTLVASLLPTGLTLDTKDGSAFVSLVTLDQENARLKGVALPGCQGCVQAGLHTYVKAGINAGVFCLREFVGGRVLAWFTRRFLAEPCQRVPMTSDIHHTSAGIEIKRTFEVGGKSQRATVAATSDPPQLPEEGGWQSFFLDRPWFFSRHGTELRGHQVFRHRWLLYRVQWADLHIGWERAFGAPWNALRGHRPASTVLAEGSDVTVL